MLLSVVIPCYNEGENITLIFERIESLDLKSESNIEIILVDNGSTDNSKEIFEKNQKCFDFVKVVTVNKNEGYGFGILSGLKHAQGEFLGWTHADSQTDLGDVVKAYELLKQHEFSTNIYLKGKREGRPVFDEFFTVGMSFFESLLLRKKLVDINAQPNIFHRSFYETWDNPPKDFSLDLFSLYMAQKKKIKLLRFPVLFLERVHGESSWNKGLKSKWKFIKRTMNFSFELKKRIK